MRQIIDMPLPLLRLTSAVWDINWGGQSAGADGGGGDQLVISQFPRFTGELALRFERDGLGPWRAFRARLHGRQNAVRVRMLDPALMPAAGPDVHAGLQAWLSGVYVEPRPQVRCVGAVLAGATAITVDESQAIAPVQVGQHLSFGDWPFIVLGRTGGGAAAVLEVDMLRVAIPANGMIDTIARGVFVMTESSGGAAGYSRNMRIAPAFSLAEWITRP